MDLYLKVRVLGHGNFGAAILVQEQNTGEFYVMKQTSIFKKILLANLSEKGRQQAFSEVTVLQQCCSDKFPFICQFQRYFVDSLTDTLCIVLDYYPCGDLCTFIKDQRGFLIEESKIIFMFAQLCLALKHLHNMRILHRDVKTQNVFIASDGTLRLGDFGISRVLSQAEDFACTAVGTPYYLSPEICDGKPYGIKSDIYALGCILYQLCTLHYPFVATHFNALVAKILKNDYEPLSCVYSPSLSKLVKSMLHREPELRPTIDEILNTSWVQKSLVESAPTNKLDAILSKWNKFDPKQLATHENENLHSMSTLLSASYVVVAELKYDENPELLFNDSFRISNLVTSESISPTMRIEQIRVFLEKKLGADKFWEAYQSAKRMKTYSAESAYVALMRRLVELESHVYTKVET